MLERQQYEEFSERGFTRLPGALGPEVIEPMVERIWRALEEQHGMHRNDPATWIPGGVRGIGALNQEAVFRPFGSPALRSAIDGFLGEDSWKTPPSWGQILVTFPDATWRWNSLFQDQVEVTAVNWHTDYPYDSPPDALVGIQTFALLADLGSGGGGTLVVEGSHRLVSDFVRTQPAETLAKMKRARLALMKSDPWLERISRAVSMPRPEPWIEEHRTTIRGTGVALAELTGQAGDVYLTHPWLLHAPSPNCNSSPRLMCTQRIRSSTT